MIKIGIKQLKYVLNKLGNGYNLLHKFSPSTRQPQIDRGFSETCE